MLITEQLLYQTDISSYLRCSIKKAVCKNFAIFTGVTWWSLFWDGWNQPNDANFMKARNQLQYSEFFEDVVLNILVVGYIQEYNISYLRTWVFLRVLFVLHMRWTVWIVSDFWAWHEMILSSCLHELSTWGFHQSEHPKSLCCSGVPQVHYYVLIWIYQVDLVVPFFSCIDANSRYFVLSSLKTKLLCTAQSDSF